MVHYCYDYVLYQVCLLIFFKCLISLALTYELNSLGHPTQDTRESSLPFAVLVFKILSILYNLFGEIFTFYNSCW